MQVKHQKKPAKREEKGDWEGPLNWDSPEIWEPEETQDNMDPNQENMDPNQETQEYWEDDHADTSRYWEENETPQEEEGMHVDAIDETENTQEQWTAWQQQEEEAQLQDEQEQWKLQQQQRRQKWKPKGPRPKTMKFMDKPVPAPQIIPQGHPRFAPLNVGTYGKGEGKWGYPTPLTHPASSGNPSVGFMHPINDPRLAPFFANHARMMGKGNPQGWQPPKPPTPQPKVGPKKRRPPTLVEETECETSSAEEITRKEKMPKRRQVLVKLHSGKRVLADYWDV